MPGLSEDQFIESFLASQTGILHFIQCLVPSLADAEEVLQETAMVLWQKRLEFDAERGQFIGWGCGIAKYKAMDYLRRQRHYNALDEVVTLRLAEIAIIEACDQERSKTALRALESCLQQLPDGSKTLLEQHYFKQVAVADIAESLGKAASTIYERLQNVRMALARCMERQLRTDS